MNKERGVPYFVYGPEMVGLSRHRNLKDKIIESRSRLGAAQSANLFIDSKGFPILGIGKNPESFVFGEIFYMNMKGIKHMKRMYKKEYPQSKLMKIFVRVVEVYDQGLRTANAIEKKVRVYGIPYEEAILNVGQGKLRYSLHTWYRSELSSPSPEKRDNYPSSNTIIADLLDPEDEEIY